MILDEGHRLKNTESKSLEKLKKIKSNHVVLLTGTPLQNNTKELWSLLNFIDPNNFNNCEQFMADFGELKQSEQVCVCVCCAVVVSV